MTSLKQTYQKDHCFQYDIRLKNLKEDLKKAGLAREEADQLKISDFTFKYIPKTNHKRCKEVKDFIICHEWLGTMPHRPTHRFVATYKGYLAGVVVMATPNSFSHLLGKENRDLEKLISRGACISWSPKNLGSALVMFSIRWMVKNTSYRFFTAYSDTEAKELGTIYQACNFIYLGQDSGARAEYFDPNNPLKGWFSDRTFRKVSSYKRYALELEMAWQKGWSSRDKIHWQRIPVGIKSKLKEREKKYRESCKKRELPRKHKYLYILGKTKKESRRLKKIFKLINPDKLTLSYPKRKTSSHAAVQKVKKAPIHLTNSSSLCRPWPLKIKEDHYMSLKEVALKYKISLSLLYRLVHEQPSFPVKNIGLKKKFVVKLSELEQWIEKRSRKERISLTELPTADELLGGSN